MSRSQKTEDDIFDCISEGRVQHLDAILNKYPKMVHRSVADGSTWIHAAAFYERVEAIPVIVRHGLYIDAKDRLGHTALGLAIECTLKPHIIKALLEYGANARQLSRPNGKPLLHQTIDHLTGLHSIEEEIAVVRLLAHHGADLNELDETGMSPLEYCVFHEKFEMAVELISLGASVKVLGRNKQDVFEYAQSMGMSGFADRLRGWIEASKVLQIIDDQNSSSSKLRALS